VAFQLTVLYKQPDDVEAFDKYYESTHVPLATKMPGLRSFTISGPVPGPDGAQPLYHLVALLTWDSAEDFQAGTGSPEGQAALADVANFATGGVDVLTGPVYPLV
jgi:uncharacterized protein (TIGR02118 family)